MTAPFSFSKYSQDLNRVIADFDWSQLEPLAQEIKDCWIQKKAVFLCGNGGSAANAMHLANDFIYGINPQGNGLRVISLADNSSIITCLGNDTGYENVFAGQLLSHASPGDLLIAFSGSGNSPNVLKAIEIAKGMALRTAAILGYNGGKCKNAVDICIHFPIQDMQISEDLQQIVGHMLTRYLRESIESC